MIKIFGNDYEGDLNAQSKIKMPTSQTSVNRLGKLEIEIILHSTYICYLVNKVTIFLFFNYIHTVVILKK
jgi:hypothetical protein